MTRQKQQSTSEMNFLENPMFFDASRFEAMTEAADWYSEFMTRANTEALQFLNKRLTEDFELPSKITKCKTPAEVAQTQMEFFQNMVRDYSIETQRMWGITMRGMQNGNWPQYPKHTNGKSHRRPRSNVTAQ